MAYKKIKNQKIKKQWLKDLRSGSYKQCSGSLCKVGKGNKKASYCCLGILGRSIQKTKLLNLTFIKSPYVKNEKVISYKNVNESGILPIELSAELGLNDASLDKLIGMNDNDGANFEEIADFIEKSL